MTVIEFLDRLDALPKSFSDFRIAIERDDNAYFVMDIEIDVEKRVITLIDNSKVTLDDIVCDAFNRAGSCDRKSKWPSDIDHILELS